MKTQTRLIVLLALLTAVFVAATWLLRSSHREETAELTESVREERAALFDRLFELTGQSLRSFSVDYSNWGEMLQFVEKTDPAWAAVNIDASMPNFGANATWVICPQGKQAYGAVRELDATLKKLPLPTATLLPYLQRVRFAHFFANTADGLLEFRAAPIQPSEDLERTTPPRGWLIVARKWSEPVRENLCLLLGGDVTLESPETAPPALPSNQIEITRALRDFNGQTVALVRLRTKVRDWEAVESQNTYEMLLLVGFGLTVIGAATFGVSRWIVTPLKRIESSLLAGSAHTLRSMEPQPDVFGRLAKLVTASFEQRQNLEREVSERRRAEAALHESREELRRSVEMKTRLARDLHDGVIQSIYAAGLGLESAKASLANEAPTARAKIESAQLALNQTIREVRSFIQGLEPENTGTPGFASELRTLVTTLSSLHSADIQATIDSPSSLLTPREEVHALQIVRECVSNAIRHGSARTIIITFNTENKVPRLTIRDDGQGFDPAKARRGSGLANIASRAAEIGAALEINAQLGKGTDIVLRFAQRKSAS